MGSEAGSNGSLFNALRLCATQFSSHSQLNTYYDHLRTPLSLQDQALPVLMAQLGARELLLLF